MNERHVMLDELMPIITEKLENGNTVTFSPRGISMLPMLRQGIDTVTLSPVKGKLRKYDLPLYKRDDGKYVLHRIVKADEFYTCIGDNQFAFEKGLRHDQMIAVVTKFTRSGKEHSVSELSYKVYCVFWHYSRSFRHLWRRAVNKLKRIIKKKS